MLSTVKQKSESSIKGLKTAMELHKIMQNGSDEKDLILSRNLIKKLSKNVTDSINQYDFLMGFMDDLTIGPDNNEKSSA
jgi:hypothetical protein